MPKARRRPAGRPARPATRRGCARTRPRRTSSASPPRARRRASEAGFAEVDRAQPRRAEVAVQVAAGQRRQAGIAHDVAAGDRAEPVPRAPSSAPARAVPAVAGRGHRRPPRRRPRSTASRSWRRARRRSPRRASWPTSAITSWPFARSNENRHGLRSPRASTSGEGASRSSRISLPSSDPGPARARTGRCRRRRRRSRARACRPGPNCSCPPLWLAASVCGDRPAAAGRCAGSATSGFAAERRYSQTWISPAGLAVR